MPVIAVAICLVVGLLLVAFLVLFRALFARPSRSAYSLEWLDSFSLESYVPMQRLLDPRDVEFLSTQPGYQPEIGRRLLAERRAIFRGYLKLLISDFEQLIGLGKVMIVYADDDRTELARALFRCQLSFYCKVFTVRCKLRLHAFGWSDVDVRRLVDALAAMRDQVQAMASQSIAAAELA